MDVDVAPSANESAYATEPTSPEVIDLDDSPVRPLKRSRRLEEKQRAHSPSQEVDELADPPTEDMSDLPPSLFGVSPILINH